MKNLLNLKTKLTCLLICIVIIFSFCSFGCKNKSNNPTNTTSSSQASSSSQVDITKFSQTLQNVLTKSYYNTLINNDYKENKVLISKTSNKYQPIPYGFLESKGVDVSLIKNNSLKTKNSLYTDGNDLYVEFMVENKSTINYFTSYVVKYTLTNQELAELQALYVPTASGYKRTYYQAPFYVQELSYTKNAEFISEAYITEDSLNAAITDFNDEKYIHTNTYATYTGTYKDQDDFNCHSFNIYRNINDTGYGQGFIQETVDFGTIEVATFRDSNSLIDNKKVFTNYMSMILNNATIFEQSKKTVVAYSSLNAELINVRLPYLENILKV